MSKETDEELYREYEKRYNEAFSKTVMRPYCIPSLEKIRKTGKGEIEADCLLVDNSFSPYHHTKEKIIEYAINIHDDIERIEEDFQNGEGLCVDEYPAFPNKVYLVSENGNHRSLVYKCIGLSKVKAQKIQYSSQNQWRYCYRDSIDLPWILISWFYKNNLIDKLLWDKSERTFSFESNYAVGWILPEPSYSLFIMIKEMKKRLSLIEVAFKNDENISNIANVLHRSAIQLVLTIKLTYYKRIILEKLGLMK